MTTNTLPPAVMADELTWHLPAGGEVLCYHRAGVGRPLLLLHSMNAAPSAYEVSPFFTEPALKLECPLYAPDLPGFGRSERKDRDYTPAFYARVIAEIAEAIGAGAVDVLALSTTAEFAARAAAECPHLINSLVLVSPTGFSRRRETAFTAGPKVHKVLSAPLVGSNLFKLLRSRRSIRYFLNMGFEGSAPEAMIDYAYHTARAPGASHAPFYFLSGQMFAHDAVGDLYLPLQQPVLVLYDKDPNISFTHLDEVLASRDNWTVSRISPTRGLPHFEEPEATRAAMEPFFHHV